MLHADVDVAASFSFLSLLVLLLVLLVLIHRMLFPLAVKSRCSAKLASPNARALCQTRRKPESASAVAFGRFSAGPDEDCARQRLREIGNHVSKLRAFQPLPSLWVAGP